MDFQRACDILGLPQEELTKSTIKKAYYKAALIHHPDKNRGNGEQFKLVNEAYSFLLSHNGDFGLIDEDICEEPQTYAEIFARFVESTTGTKITKDTVDSVLSGLHNGCQKIAVESCKSMSRDDAMRLFTYLQRFSGLIGVSDDTLQELEMIIQEKMKNTELVTIKPTMNNLVDDDVYKLELGGETYFVPMWHEEVEFDLPSGSLVVRVIPDLPSNIVIDEDNCVYISLKMASKDVIETGEVTFMLGDRLFKIDARTLSLKKRQTVRMKSVGVARIDPKCMFSTTKRGGIIVSLELF